MSDPTFQSISPSKNVREKTPDFSMHITYPRPPAAAKRLPPDAQLPIHFTPRWCKQPEIVCFRRQFLSARGGLKTYLLLQESAKTTLPVLCVAETFSEN